MSPDRAARLAQTKSSSRSGAEPRLRSLAGGASEHNLPAPPDELIGRTADLAAITSALGSSRLVTVTGPGGVGKSRAAIAAAWDMLDRFPAGTWLVELSGLTEPALVPAAIASSLRAGERLDDPLSGVVQRVGTTPVLVVLDNCEHVLAAVGEVVARLLSACPALRVMATSRSALEVRGELVIEIAGLASPTSDSVASVTGSPAVELFVRHARVRRPSFTLTPANAAAVTSICQRLDGLPLALELAAMWVDVLTVEEIERRLGDRFGFLTRAPHDVPRRHETLRSILDGSFELLTDEERRLLERLGALPGRFDLRVASVVAGCDESAVAIPLAGLRAKSLVQASERAGVMTFALLDTTRAYARERLAAAGAYEDVFSGLAASLYDTAVTVEYLGGQAALVREFGTNIDSYRAVLSWFAAHGAWDKFVPIAVQLWLYLDLTGAATEARHWLEMGLDDAHAGSAPPSYPALGLSFLAHTRWRQGAPQEARRLAARSIELFTEDREFDGVAWAQQVLACAEMTLGQYDTAQELLEAAVATFLAGGRESQAAHALLTLGQLIDRRGDRAGAEHVLQEALSLARKVGNELRIALVLNSLATCAERDRDVAVSRPLRLELRALAEPLGIAHCLGEAAMGLAFADLVDGQVETAEATAQQALDTLRSTGYHDTEMAALSLLGTICRVRGDFPAAAAHQSAALEGRLAIGDVAGVGQSLAAISRLAVAEGALTQAARWMPVAIEIGTRGTFSAWESDDETLSAIGRRNDTAAPLHRDQAVAEALDWCVAPRKWTSTSPGGLTPRETEIISLVAGGMSDKQIADALKISSRTVGRHLSTAYRKLGARNRTDAVRVYTNQT